MSRAHLGDGLDDGRFPRVSGDEPGISSVISTVAGFSPRERG